MKDLIIKIFNTRTERRSPVHEQMFSLNAEGKGCHDCKGVCCTSIANSMQIDLVQAIDLYLYLLRKDAFRPEELEQNILDYRLEILSTGKGSQIFRKRYTCPYYAGGNLGCRISINSKPYGCLAFNPIGKGVKEGENCRSYQESLQAREDEFASSEHELNEALASYTALINDSQVIPIKLLEVHKYFQTHPHELAQLKEVTHQLK